MTVSPDIAAIIARQNARFGVGAISTPDSPGRGNIREPHSAGQKFLDLLSRPEYASANFWGALLRGNENPFSEAWEGITGQKRYDFIDLAHEELGLSDKPFFHVPDIKFVPDLIERLTESLLTPSGVTGIALGFALDPLSWVAPFQSTKLGKLGRLAKGVESEQSALLARLSRESGRIQALHGSDAAMAWLREQAPRVRALDLPKTTGPLAGAKQLLFPAEGYIQPGSKLAREWEAEFQRTGRLPASLASTLAKQAERGQLSLFSIVTPLGRTLVEGPPGMPITGAMSKLAEIARQTPQVKDALQIFSHFNIPPQFMDSIAEWNARRRGPVNEVEKMLRATYKMLDLDGTQSRKSANRAILGAIQGTPRVSEQRLASAARSGSVTDRILGTADLIRRADGEALGMVAPELDIARQELGLLPGQPLVQFTDATGIPLTKLDPLRTDDKLLGLEWKLEQPTAGRGVTRIIVDRDARPSADTIRRQLLEIDQQLSKAAPEMELEALHERRQQLQRSLGHALQDPVHQRPWRMLVYGKPKDATQYWAPKILASEVPVIVGRSGSLKELEPIVLELLEGAQVPLRVASLTPEASGAYLARVGRLDPVERMLSERARLAARFAETTSGLMPHTKDFDQAHRLATENLDPDLLQLERVDRALERLGATAIGLGRGKRLTGKTQSIIPLGKARSLLGAIDQGRFAGLPTIIRQASLEIEEVLDNLWTAEASRGITPSRRPSYFPRIRNEDFALTPWIRGFAHKGPMVERKMPFSRRAEFMRDLGILDINRLQNKEFFLEDVMTGIGLRATASARAIAYHDFINRTLDMFATRKITTTQAARDFMRTNADEEWALFYPKGTVKWYPTHVVSDAAIERGVARTAGATGPRGQALVELTEDEIKQGFGASWNAPAYALPREIADHLNRVDQLVSSSRGVAMFADTIRKFRGVWSKWTLFWFPGFIARNVVGNIGNMLYSGFRRPELFQAAMDIQRGKEWRVVTESGLTLTEDSVLKMASEKGVIDTGWAMSEFFSNTEAGAREWDMVKRFQAADTKGKRKLLETMKEPGVMRMMMRVNGWMENNAKLTLFMDRLLKGDTPDLAARNVRKYLFDYDEIRPTERFLKNHVLPYYVWTRKNIPLQFEMAARRPAVFANLARAQRLIEASSDPGVEILPQWMHESMPVRLKESEDGSGFEYLTLRGWLPAADVETALSPLHSALGMLGPWFRLPIERKANYSFWFRRPIEQPRGQKGYFLGLTLDRSDIELLSSLRLLSEVDRLIPAPANSPLAGFQAPLWDRLMGSSLTGIGLKTYKVQMARQRQIARAQKERILRELRIQLSRAKKRRDYDNVQHIQGMIADEERRNPDVVLPLSITGLPTEP